MFYKTNEKLEAINSLEFVFDQVDKISDDISKWKWVLIGLHNSLQNYMVCALRGTNNLNVLAKKSALKWLEEFSDRFVAKKSNWEYPEEKLDTFTNLFDKIQSDNMKMYFHSKVFQPTQIQIDCVSKLNLYRNDFIHFVPRGLLFGVVGLPKLVFEVLGIIEFLAFESGNIVWLEELELQRTEDAISKIKEKLKIIEAT